MFIRFSITAFLTWVLLASTGQAAKLFATGATDVDVNGSLYDVEFVDGSCISLFNGCYDQHTDLDFFTEADALAAASSLDALFDLYPLFDDAPKSISGCEDNLRCQILIPFSISRLSFSAVDLTNSVVPVSDEIYLSLLPVSFDTNGDPASVFSRWTPVIPEL